MKPKTPEADLKYLLDAGYPRQSALDFVSNHYRLALPERNRLSRTVYSETEIKEHRRRLTPVQKIRGKKVSVDGFNVLITAEAVLSGGDWFRSMDGFVRDNCMVFSNYRMTKTTFDAVKAVLKILAKNKPSEVVFYFDSQISRSGELAAFIRNEMKEAGLKGTAWATGMVDHELKRLGWITATSDSTVIESVGKAVDLPAALIRRK